MAKETKKPDETKESNKHLPILASGRGLALRSMDDMWRFACAVRDSGLAPASLNKPEQILIAIQSGAELGIPPMKALNSITVINGSARLWGDMPLALVRQSKLMEYIEESITGTGDERAAVCKSKRLDSPNAVTTTFSVDDAKLAGLWGKAGPWRQYPERMLKYRARAFNLRDNFPDALAGIGIQEEFEGLPQPDYEPDTPRREDRRPVESADITVALKNCANEFLLSLGFEPDDIAYAFAQMASYVLKGGPSDYLKEDGTLDASKFNDEGIDKILKELVTGIPEPVKQSIPQKEMTEAEVDAHVEEKLAEYKYACLSSKCGELFNEPKGTKKKPLCPVCLTDDIQVNNEG